MVFKIISYLNTLLRGGFLEEKSQQAIHTAKNYQIGKVAEKFLEDFTKVSLLKLFCQKLLVCGLISIF